MAKVLTPDKSLTQLPWFKQVLISLHIAFPYCLIPRIQFLVEAERDPNDSFSRNKIFGPGFNGREISPKLWDAPEV